MVVPKGTIQIVYWIDPPGGEQKTLKKVLDRILHVLEIKNLKKYFEHKKWLSLKAKRVVKAVDGVSFTVRKGETFGLVGESGCGKTTVARCITRLVEPTSGEIFYEGTNILELNKHEFRKFRSKVQMIFQDRSCLDPRMRVADLVAEPLRIHGVDKRQRIKRAEEVLEAVELDARYLSRLPHMLSGGERQRIIIARALALKPELLIADEPVSSLDVSIGASILNLLKNLKEMFGLTLVFISHDLGVVKHISKNIAVMYVGKIVEMGSKKIFEEPYHPYTLALVSSIPGSWLKDKRIILKGEVPDPANIPNGCEFHKRCPYAKQICVIKKPALQRIGSRQVACHFAYAGTANSAFKSLSRVTDQSGKYGAKTT